MLRLHRFSPHRVRPASGTSSRNEGVVLILTLFVLLITFALVTELTVSTSVAFQTTKNQANRVRMKMAATAAADQFMQALVDDASGAGGQSGLGGLLGGQAEMGELASSLDGFDESVGGTESLEASFGDEDPEAEGQEGSSDSLQDVWAKPMRIMVGDLQITAWAEDENGKFNLHQLVAGDEDAQDASRKRFIRILNHLREDFDDDLDDFAAQLIVEDIVRWMKGETVDEDWPRALRHSDDPEAETPVFLGGALEELLLLEHIDENLFYDQVRSSDLIAPGLESICTLYTTLAFEPPTVSGETGTTLEDEQELGLNEQALSALNSNDGQDSETSLDVLSGEAEAVTPPQGGLDDVLDGDPALGWKININTAPQAVVQGLISVYDMPSGVVQRILEYRNEVDEEKLLETDNQEYDRDLQDLQESLYGQDEEDPLQFFSSIDQLMDVESYEFGASQEARDAFEELIDVNSDIFTIFLYVRIPPEGWQQEKRYEEPRGPVLRLRSVVWRRNGSDGAKLIPIHPWHEVERTRWKVPDFQYDLPLFEPPKW